MYIRTQKVRLIIIFFSYLLMLLVILFRLLNVQVLNNSDYVKLADSQHRLRLTLYPQRGVIYDRSKKALALSLRVSSVFAIPREIEHEHKEDVAKNLSQVLGLNYDDILVKLKKDKSFVWIKRRIREEEEQALKRLNLEGVDLLKEDKRYYPNDSMLAHVVGFAGIDERGLEGCELEYNEYLKGQSGHRSLLRDAKQRMMPAFEFEFVPAIDGFDLVLNIDEIIQHIVEDELDKAFTENNALGASVIVMDPENGEIYALANRPTYNLNLFKNSTDATRRNRAVTDYFEPGSTFKIITASAAIEEKAVSLDEIFYCENGSYRVASHTLHDHRPHGNLTFVEVIEKSSNIGVVKVAQKMGEATIYRYIKKFCFGEKTGIDLPGETAGFLRPLNEWSKLSISALPIGHEIGTSALQMVRAMAVIANGGYLVKPRVVQKIVDNKGEILYDFRDLPRKRIISENTAKTMRQILTGVVNNGTGQKAKPQGYLAAGKTGTAQKIDSTGRYSHNKYVASFVGFIPAAKPRFVIAVIFDEPHPYYYGGTVCAPVFKEIAEKILSYMNVPQESTQTEKIEDSGGGD
ncbi:MAG: penicillin-binding protein [Candidatus Omnitrophica bacterium]|nr:penicillin-binding protein [Candidatus Omnitrophota bacterium]